MKHKMGQKRFRKRPSFFPILILLDISMPGSSGMEVALALREKVGNAKIVIMSQHDPAILLPIALQAGGARLHRQEADSRCRLGSHHRESSAERSSFSAMTLRGGLDGYSNSPCSAQIPFKRITLLV